jgi:hypothetical protein
MIFKVKNGVLINGNRGGGREGAKEKRFYMQFQPTLCIFNSILFTHFKQKFLYL